MTASQPGWTKGRREAVARIIDPDPDVWAVENDAPAIVKDRALRRQIGALHKADAILASDPAPSLYEALEKLRVEVNGGIAGGQLNRRLLDALTEAAKVLALARGEQP